jgi:hypothetical protein
VNRRKPGTSQILPGPDVLEPYLGPMCSRAIVAWSSRSRMRVPYTLPLVASFSICLLRTQHECSIAHVHHQVVQSTNLLGMMSTFCWCVARMTACAWCLGLSYALANSDHYVEYRNHFNWLEKLNLLETTDHRQSCANLPNP